MKIFITALIDRLQIINKDFFYSVPVSFIFKHHSNEVATCQLPKEGKPVFTHLVLLMLWQCRHDTTSGQPAASISTALFQPVPSIRLLVGRNHQQTLPGCGTSATWGDCVLLLGWRAPGKCHGLGGTSATWGDCVLLLGWRAPGKCHGLGGTSATWGDCVLHLGWRAPGKCHGLGDTSATWGDCVLLLGWRAPGKCHGLGGTSATWGDCVLHLGWRAPGKCHGLGGTSATWGDCVLLLGWRAPGKFHGLDGTSATWGTVSYSLDDEL